MTGEKHMRLTIYGDYTAASDHPEIWAVNIRQALVFGSVDPIGTFPSNWDVVETPASHTETYWTTRTSWHAVDLLTSTFDPELYLTTNVGPALQAWIGGAGKFRTSVRCLGAKLYPCDTTGKSIDGNVAELVFTTANTGSETGNMLPPEVSCCYSWETARHGPRGRGRIYPPPVTVAANDTYGLVTTSAQTSFLSAGKNLIESLSASSVALLGAHVRSVVTGPGKVGATRKYLDYAVINGVRVGLVWDAQRRRRNKLAEAYSASTITQS